MPAFNIHKGISPALSSGMDSHRLAGDQPIFKQHLDLLMEAGVGDFIGLTEIQSDLSARAQHTGSKPLLKPEETPAVAAAGGQFLSMV